MSPELIPEARLNEFADQIRWHIHANEERYWWDLEAICTFVRPDLATAKEFVRSLLRGKEADSPRAVEEAAAVTAAYQMHTGDGSLWPAVEARARQLTYLLYEKISVATPYHEVGLWEEAPERSAAREYWLVSGQKDAVCDKCQRFLARGTGFLVRNGVQKLGPGADRVGLMLQIDLGDELFCEKCFGESGQLARRPLSMAEWDRLFGRDDATQEDLWAGPPVEDPSSLIALVETGDQALARLRAWIHSRNPPHATNDGSELPDESLRDDRLHRWIRWAEELGVEANRAAEVRATDLDQSIVLARGLFLLSNLIPFTPIKRVVLFALKKLFEVVSSGFEFTEVIAQLAASARFMRDVAEDEESRRESSTEYLARLKTLTERLYNAKRYDESLAWGFERLAQTMRSCNQEDTREPRFLIAKTLRRLGHRTLARQALESNGLFQWLQLPASMAPLDRCMWLHGLEYGGALKEDGEAGEAIGVFLRLSAPIPDNIEQYSVALLYSELGLAYGAIGDLSNAEHYLTEAAVRAEVILDDDISRNAARHWQSMVTHLRVLRTRVPETSPAPHSVDISTRDPLFHSLESLRVLFAEERWEEAIPILRSAVNASRREGNDLALGSAFLNLGLVYLSKNQPEVNQALEYFTEGIRISDRIGEHLSRVTARILIAEALFNLKEFDRCQTILNDAIHAATDVLARNLSSSTRQEIARNVFNAFELLVEIAARDGAWPKVVWLSEQTRARTLTRWMTIGRLGELQCAADGPNMVQCILQELRAAEVEAEVRHLTRAGDGERLRELARECEQYRTSLDRWLVQSGHPIPQWDKYFRDFDPQVFDDELRQLIKPGVAVLFLFSGLQRFHWVVASRYPAESERIACGGRLPDVDWDWEHVRRMAAVGAIREELSRRGRDLGPDVELKGDDPHAALRQAMVGMGMTPELTGVGTLTLWNYFLISIGKAITKRGVNRLIVVPHRELALLPFWVLVDQCKLEGITVVPSLEAALVCEARERVVVGPTVIVPDVTSSLPFARAEVGVVEAMRLQHGEIVQADAYATLAGQASKLAVLHVAAHGHFHEDNPYDSGFPVGPADDEQGFFARFTPPDQYAPTSKPTAGGYRLMTAAGVMGLSFHDSCRLVVLSTCESGVPRMHDGGELVGLPNAFLLAGAKSVIASLWRVDDRATYLLIRYFYEAWTGGSGTEPSPAVALATARQRLRRTDRATALELLEAGISLPDKEFPFDHPAYSDAFHCHGGW